MKYLTAIVFLLFVCVGCMFVTESYSPSDGGGYTFNGSCVGFTWEECKSRADVLCSNVGQSVATIKQAGGPENRPGIAIVPKKVLVTCQEK